MGCESLLLSKSPSIPVPPPSLRLGAEPGGFSALLTVSNVLQRSGHCVGWISIAKGSQLCLYRALPRDTEVTTPLELPAADFGYDLALVLGGWAGLGTKGFVLPVPLAGKRNSPQRKSLYQEHLSRQGSRTGGVN